MYAYIKGLLSEQEENYIVIENNGIGYMINCPLSMSMNIGGVGDEVCVYLYQAVREDDISLYGFPSRDVKEMFLMLLSVSGVGPKVAHNICAQLNPSDFAMAVLADNVSALSAVKGLGKKGAEKIIVEVRDKVKKTTGKAVGGSVAVSGSASASASVSSLVVTDAIGALVMLGYRETDAQDFVSSAYDPSMSLEELIKASLKIAAGKKK